MFTHSSAFTDIARDPHRKLTMYHMLKTRELHVFDTIHHPPMRRVNQTKATCQSNYSAAGLAPGLVGLKPAVCGGF